MQYVATLVLYADQLQKPPADTGDGGSVVPSDQMTQHWEKVARIEGALNAASAVRQASGPAGVVDVDAGGTDTGALTQVRGASVSAEVPGEVPPATPPLRNQPAQPQKVRHRKPSLLSTASDATTKQRRGGGGGTKADEDLREELAGDLLDMTRQFRQQQEELNRHAKFDAKVVEKTDELISSNTEKLGLQNSKLQKLADATGGWATCKIIFGLIACMCVFMGAFVFMRIFGKRGEHVPVRLD